MPQQNEETEIKLRVADVPALQRCLKQLRARKSSPRIFESSTIYDTREGSLLRQGKFIRIRTEQAVSNRNRKSQSEPGHAVLTCKGPSQSARSRGTPPGKHAATSRYKVMQEFETLVTDAKEMRHILTMLGLVPVFRYEKFRTTFVLPNLKSLKIELDETPMGIFLELEGPPADIDRAALALGYNSQDYIAQSYGALYGSHCRRRGKKPGDMIFKPSKKSR